MLVSGQAWSRAAIRRANDRGGGQTDGALPRLQGGAPSFGGLIGLIEQALAQQIVDDGQVGERLPELDPAVWPGPQAFPVQKLLKSFRF